MVDGMPFRERRDDEQGRTGPEARFAAGIAHARILTPGEVWLAVDEWSEVRISGHRRRHVVPPAARLVEGKNDRRVPPVAAGLHATDEVTDEGVIGDRRRVGGVAVRGLRRLDP